MVDLASMQSIEEFRKDRANRLSVQLQRIKQIKKVISAEFTPDLKRARRLRSFGLSKTQINFSKIKVEKIR